MPSAAATHPRAGSAAPGNRNDHVPNNAYDQDVDDFLRDLPIENDDDAQPRVAEPAQDLSQNPDAEVKVRKQRKPIAKLDETLLLSEAGIPKLRRVAKTKLKFKGKGHEFSDIARLLNMYQLWLDDMYPKAKFRDGLAMVEKLGHRKRMQIMRRGWMDATKPNRRDASPERLGDALMSGGATGLPGDGTRQDGSDDDDILGDAAYLDMSNENRGHEAAEQDGIPDDDELDALMAEQTATTSRETHPPQQRRRTAPFQDDGEPDEDELDALMAEEAVGPASKGESAPNQRQGPFEEDEAGPDEDELDALLAEESSAARASGPSMAKSGPAPNQRQNQGEPDEFADEEEVLASMGGVW